MDDTTENRQISREMREMRICTNRRSRDVFRSALSLDDDEIVSDPSGASEVRASRSRGAERQSRTPLTSGTDTDYAQR